LNSRSSMARSPMSIPNIRASRPNPSVKRSANGRPPSPRRQQGQVSN
jgi:hypothetical protein